MTEIQSRTVRLSGGPRDGEIIVLPIGKTEVVMPVPPAIALLNGFDVDSMIRRAFYQIDLNNPSVFTFRYIV